MTLLLGMGDAGILPADPLTQSSADLIAWLAVNPCTQQPITQVSAFQTAWNASGNGSSLAVDGKYGPLTRGALQAVMTTIGKGAAPADCFTSVGAPAASTSVVPAVPNSTVTFAYQPSPVPSPIPWLISGAVIAGAGVIAYTYWQRHHAKRR
jgi:hypothetical protein